MQISDIFYHNPMGLGLKENLLISNKFITLPSQNQTWGIRAYWYLDIQVIIQFSANSAVITAL